MGLEIEQFRSGGVLPSGPCSLWPQERNKSVIQEESGAMFVETRSPRPTYVHASTPRMLRGLANTAAQAIRNGKVSAEIREERYDTCKSCPFFVEDSKRCSECGCFMEAKTWVGGDPKQLCPKKKWSR